MEFHAMARRRKSSDHFGLSLIELLVAVTILSVALAVYLQVALLTRAAQDKGNYFTIASQVVGDKLADYQGMGYSGLPAFGTTVYSVSGLPKGQMTITVGSLDNNVSNLNITEVDIRLTWGLSNNKLPQEAGSVTQSLLVSAP